MGVVDQLYTIVWKDVYVQAIKRHYYVTTVEVVLIILSFFAVEHDRPILPHKHCAKPPCLRYSEPREYHERQLGNFSCPQMVTRFYHERRFSPRSLADVWYQNGAETTRHCPKWRHPACPLQAYTRFMTHLLFSLELNDHFDTLHLTSATILGVIMPVFMTSL
nr:uncharacterized protein LOC126532428 [Dermacentor andersoni]